MLAEAAAEEAAAAAALGVRRVGAVEDLRCLEENLDSNVERRSAPISYRIEDDLGLAAGSNAGEDQILAAPYGSSGGFTKYLFSPRALFCQPMCM